MLPLEGVRVLDLSHLGPGMFCTMLLGDFGAEVISVERPREGADKPTESGRSSSGYERQVEVIRNSLGRNKKSITINIKSTEGRNIFLKLAQHADVIVEGFRPGVVERLGIDYKCVKSINPGIIYCSISGYGQDSPYIDLPGHDLNFIAMAGILDLIGKRGGPPVIPEYFLADLAGAALHSVIGILLALHAQRMTGQGQHIDIAYVDTVMSLLTTIMYDHLNNGVTCRRGETISGGAFPCYNVYETRDGKYISIACFEPWLWQNLCHALQKEEFIPHQFPEGEKKEAIFSYFRQAFLTRTRDEWFDFLKEKNICTSKVYSIDEVVSDLHVVHRQLIQETSNPIWGKRRHLGPMIKLSATPGRVRSDAPYPGQNTDELLLALGYTPERTEELRRQGIVGLSPSLKRRQTG
jgi:crotonobetainyl-CoA:carnitine CoA-transferase CaiB-like acyl-CoA transferase